MHSASYAGFMCLYSTPESRKACVVTKKKNAAVSGPNGEHLIKNLAVASTVLELEEHVIRSLRRAEFIHNLYQFFQLTKHHNSWQSITILVSLGLQKFTGRLSFTPAGAVTVEQTMECGCQNSTCYREDYYESYWEVVQGTNVTNETVTIVREKVIRLM